MQCSFCHCKIDGDKPGNRYLELAVKEIVYGEYTYYSIDNDKALLCSKECLEEYMKGKRFGW